MGRRLPPERVAEWSTSPAPVLRRQWGRAWLTHRRVASTIWQAHAARVLREQAPGILVSEVRWLDPVLVRVLPDGTYRRWSIMDGHEDQARHELRRAEVDVDLSRGELAAIELAEWPREPLPWAEHWRAS